MGFLLCVRVLVAQSCLTLCDPMDYNPPGSSVHGISQATILEWVLFPSPGELPYPWVESASPALAGRFFTTKTPGKPIENCMYFLEFSPLGSSCTLRERTYSDHSL